MYKLLPGKTNNFNHKDFDYLAKPTDYIKSIYVKLLSDRKERRYLK